MNPTRLVRAALCAAALSAVLTASTVHAEDTELEVGRWYPAVEAGLTLAQSTYSNNWSGGNNGQITWTFILNAELKKRLSDNYSWRNNLKLAYGQTSNQNKGEGWTKPDKSTDRIDFESLMRGTYGLALDPYAALRIETQFEDASDPFDRSLLFNPMFLKQSAGLAHEFYGEEKRQLLVRFGGSLHEAIRSQFTNFTDPTDETTVSETGIDAGLEFIIDYKNVFFEDAVAWTSKLGFFQPLFYSAKSDFEDLGTAALVAAGVDPDVADFTTTLDIDWENIFTAQLTKVLSVNLYMRLVYDKYDTSVEPLIEGGVLTNGTAVAQAIRKAGQFKQTLAVGLTYRFF